jgi:glycosyltransferase involved in cell wall biosynthesis
VLAYFRFVLSAALALRRHHRQQPFDLIQAHTMPDFVVFSAWSLRRAGVPVLLDIHDLMPELFVSKFGLSERHPVVRMLRWQERASARWASRCLAVHHRHRQLLESRSGPDLSIEVVHNLPDPRWFPVTPPMLRDSNQVRIVYHGTVAHRHGIELAVRAMHALHAELPHSRLDIYGDGDASNSVLSLIRELGAASYVGFQPGMIPLEQLVPSLEGSDIGVIPLLADGFTQYMLPTKLLEYAAMGIPVIASDLTSIRDYFQDSQVEYVKPGDLADLIDALRRLVTDSQHRYRLATGAAKFYEQHNWASEERKYLGVVELMTQGNGLGRDRSIA